MDKTVEEAFEEWWNLELDEEKPHYWLELKAAFATGAAHGVAEALEIATTLPRIQVEGQWLIDLDELERRLTEK